MIGSELTYDGTETQFAIRLRVSKGNRIDRRAERRGVLKV